MWLDASKILEGARINADVVVVGSGAGGTVVASRLAAKRRDVLLIEEGEHLPSAEMTQSEHEMIPRLFQEAGQRATADQAIMIMQGRALGGGTSHNTGLCVPIAEATFDEWRRAHGLEHSWQDARNAIGQVMSAIHARPADEDEVNANNRILRDGATKLGLSWFLAHHNRLRCSGCGYCSLGCAYNRKMSVVHAFLPEGLKHGLRLLTGCRVVRLGRDGRSGFVLDANLDGRPIIVAARTLVLASGAIHTPILLEGSGILRGHRVGRDLRLHPFAPVGALFDEEIDAHRGVPQTVLIDDRAHFLRGGEGGYLLMVAAAQPAVTAVMTPGFGAQHHRLMLSYRRLAAAGVLVHDRARGRVRRRGDGKPLIDYWPTDEDQREFKEGIAVLARLYFAMGARAVVLPFTDLPLLEHEADVVRIDRVKFRRHSVTLGSVHPQGTCPISRRPREGVVDGHGRVHGVDGLFVADTSVFPTSLGVPPQVTTMAFAHLLADHIDAERGRG